MSVIIFGNTLDIVNAGTPSSGGYLVAYDLDGILKQKDEFGVITEIGGGPTAGIGSTPSFSESLSISNNSETYSIIMGTSTSISSANGNSRLDLDYSGSSSILLSTDNGSQLEGRLSLTQIDANFGFNDSYLKTTDDYITLSLNNQQQFLSKDNSTASVTSAGGNKYGTIIASKLSTVETGVLNSVIIGGQGLTASQNDTLYTQNLNINNQFTLPNVDGSNGQILVTDGLGNLYWANTVAQGGLDTILGIYNNSGTSSIIMGTSTSILSNNGSEILLDYGATNSILLTTDNGSFSTSYLAIENSNIVIDTPGEFTIGASAVSILTDNLEGMVYSFDYSPTFVDNSLVSKLYVDNLLTSNISGTISQIPYFIGTSSLSSTSIFNYDGNVIDIGNSYGFGGSGRVLFNINNGDGPVYPLSLDTSYGARISSSHQLSLGASSSTGIAVQSVADSSGDATGIKIVSQGGANNYGLRISDGSEGSDKFLRSVDDDGNSNWSLLNDNDIPGSFRSTQVFTSSVTIASPTTIDILVEGISVNTDTFEVTDISVNLTGVTVSGITSSVSSFLLINSNGDPVFQTSYPSLEQMSTHLGYWVIVHSDLASINVINDLSFNGDNLGSQFQQVVRLIGAIKTGLSPSEGTTGTRLNVSTGALFKIGVGTTNNNKNSVNISGQIDATFRLRTQLTEVSGDTQSIPTTQYDNGGVLTALGGSQWVAHLIVIFPSGLVRIQYGQHAYASKEAAQLGISVDPYITEENILSNGTRIGWILVRNGTTDWTDTSRFTFVGFNAFGTSLSGSGAIVTPNFQAVYNISTQPQISINDTGGSIQNKNIRSNQNNTTEEWLNSSGSVMMSINGTGNLYVAGNLLVSGTQTVVNTQNLYVRDNVITLNATYSGPPIIDSGIESNLGDGTYSKVLWDAGTGYWQVGLSGSESTIITEAGSGLLKSNNELSVDFGTVSSISYVDIGTSSIWSVIDSINNDYITEVIGGQGLTGGGTAGIITLDSQVDNGLSIENDIIVLGGTLSQNTIINGSSLDIILGNFDTILMTASVFDIEADGFVSIDAGTGSVQLLGDNITLLSNSLDLAVVNDLNFTFNTSNITDDSGNGYGLVYTSDYTGTFVTNSLITKKYADEQIGNYLPLSGGTMSGDIVMETGTSFTSPNGGLLTMEAMDGSFYFDRDNGDFTRNWIWFTDDYGPATHWGEMGVNSGATGSTTSGTLLLYNADQTNGWSNYSAIYLDKTYLSIFNGGISSKWAQIELNAEGDIIEVSGQTSSFSGIVYDSDYSSNYTNRSLVDKEYVDTLIVSNNYTEFSLSLIANIASTITHNLGTQSIICQAWDTSTGETINVTFKNRLTNSVDILSTANVTVDVIIQR